MHHRPHQFAPARARWRRAIVAAASLVAAAACTPVASTRLSNPFTFGGGVAPNRVVHPDSRRAAELGIPSDAVGLEASLLELGAHRACFAFTTRVERERLPDTPPHRWRLVLSAEPPLIAREPAFVEGAQIEERTYRSEPPLDQQVQFEQSCGGISRGGLPSPCTPVRRETMDIPLPPVTVRTTTQRVCFAIDEGLGANTRRLTLTATAPNGDPDSRRAFEWNFAR